MEIAEIKKVLKDNKEALRGKVFEVCGETYTTLKGFGLALLKLEKKNIGFEVCVSFNGFQRNINTETSIEESLKRRFDTVKVFTYSKIVKPIIIDYSHVDFKAFGTTA